jgi:hypothetical protein
VTAILDALGPKGALLQSKIFAIWKGEVMRRRTVLKLLSLTPASLLTAEQPAVTDGLPSWAAANTLDELAGKYQKLYHSAKPAHLLTPVLAHLDAVSEVLRRRPAALERRQLFQNEGRIALLAGRITFFDLHDPIAARGYYNLALEAAREAQDAFLAAAALGHIAFIPAAEHRFTAAQDYLDGASRHLEHRPQPAIASWLAAVEAEIQANSGNERGALSAIDRAQQGLSSGSNGSSLPAWFDYFDSRRLDGFAGYAYLCFKRYDDASQALDAAAAGLPPTAIKQRAVVLADIATVNLHAGALDAACHAAGRAADLLTRADYATGAERLYEFRQLLSPWKNQASVKDLDEQLALI